MKRKLKKYEDGGPTSSQFDYTQKSNNPLSGVDIETSGRRTLKRGSKGNEVSLLQTFLKNKNLYSGKVDGDFGPQTEAAVKAYQEWYNKNSKYSVSSATKNGHEVLKTMKVDGIVGDQTRAALMYRDQNPAVSSPRQPQQELVPGKEQRVNKFRAEDSHIAGEPDGINFQGGFEMLGLAGLGVGLGAAVDALGSTAGMTNVARNVIQAGKNIPKAVKPKPTLNPTIPKGSTQMPGGRSFGPQTPSGYGTRVGYATGGEVPFQPIGLPVDPSVVKEQNIEARKDTTWKDALKFLSTAAPLAANFIAPGSGMAIGAGLSSLNQINGQATGAGLMQGAQGFATGGTVSQPLNSSSFQVQGNPGKTDGNYYPQMNAKLDHNEVVKSNFVFSEKLKHPGTNKSFAEEAKKIEKAIGFAERKLKRNPSDQESMNTIKYNNKLSSELAATQENLASLMGLRNNDGSTVQSAAMGGVLKYAEGGPTNPVYMRVPAPGNRKYKDVYFDPYNNKYLTRNDDGSYNVLTGDNATEMARNYPMDPAAIQAHIQQYPGPPAPNKMLPTKWDAMSNDEVSQAYAEMASGKMEVDPEIEQVLLDRGLVNSNAGGVPAPPAVPTSTGTTPTTEAGGGSGTGKQANTSGATGDPFTRQFQTDFNRMGDLLQATLAPSDYANYMKTGKLPKKFNKLTVDGIPGPKTTAARENINEVMDMAGRRLQRQPEMDPNAAQAAGSELGASYQPQGNRPNAVGFRDPNAGQAAIPFTQVPPVVPGTTNTNDKLSKWTVGDGLQGIDVLSKFGQLIGGPEKEKAYFDTAPISKEVYDPRAALYQNQRGFQNTLNNTDVGSINTRRAVAGQLYSSKLNADNQTLAQYNQLNNQATTQYEQRLSQRQQYNNSQNVYTDDINARNRGAYKNAVQNAFTSLGNFGEAMNTKKQSYDALGILKVQYPDVYKRIIGGMNG